MIPDLTDEGLLPPGVHRATLDEVERRFAVFARSDRRIRLFERFAHLFQEAQKAGIVRHVFVAGSFVTDKDEPNDIDCLLVLDSGIVGKTLRPFEYNLTSRRMIRRAFGADVLIALENSATSQEYLTFFQSARDGTPKGIVEVLP